MIYPLVNSCNLLPIRSLLYPALPTINNALSLNGHIYELCLDYCMFRNLRNPNFYLERTIKRMKKK